MKILVLNGSPKRDKSDTMHLTNAFLNGMQEVAEQQVHIRHVIDQHINPCMGCFSCKRNGGKCIHNDDMQEILEEILTSDLLIFSFPLYCYGMPAPLKNLLDRTMPLSTLAMEQVDGRYEHPAQADFSHLRYVMISGCGFPDGENNFRAMRLQFQMMFPRGATMLTVPESPMFNVPQAEIVTKPFLALVQQAGREYAETGEISGETMDKLAVPMIPEEQYAAICNQTV